MKREHGLRRAAEQTHEAALRTITEKNDRQMEEVDRSRRLLDCSIDAAIAAMTELRERAEPSPGKILESFCASTSTWKQELAGSTPATRAATLTDFPLQREDDTGAWSKSTSTHWRG